MSNIIRMTEVIKKVGLSRTTIWRLERAGKFPKRVQLSTHAVGYRDVDISIWMAGLPAVDETMGV